jgi:hypothetical protein
MAEPIFAEFADRADLDRPGIFKPRTRRWTHGAAALGVSSCLTMLASAADAQTADPTPQPEASSPLAPTPTPPPPPPRSRTRTFRQALLFDATIAFVPYANDVPIMVGVGVRIAGIHELWVRAGYIPTGDDIGYAFGCGGYRVALRQHKLVRPLLGALFAGLPATCSHDEQGNPVCTQDPLFIIAATVGVRIEPKPWLGIFSILTLGTDTYPNPFGMIELGASFAIPLS